MFVVHIEPVTYLHGIGDIDDPKAKQTLSAALDRRKYPQAQIVLPNDSSFGQLHVNWIKTGLLYYYQDPNAFYSRILGDFMLLLAKIKTLSIGTIPVETPLSFARFVKFADGDKMHEFMQQTLKKHQNNLFIHSQFRALLMFHDEYKALRSDKLYELERWERNFDYFIKHLTLSWDVNAWITLVKISLIHYNANSYQDLHQYIMAMRSLHIPVINMAAITNQIMDMTDTMNITLNAIDESAFPLCVDAEVIQRLSSDKLIVFNAMHLVNYLNFWMIQQKLDMKKDIHVFIEQSIIKNELFTKYVINALENNGLNVDLQLVVL